MGLTISQALEEFVGFKEIDEKSSKEVESLLYGLIPNADKLLFIGRGDRGFAWKRGNIVVKITTDKNEYSAAKKLIGQKHPNVVEYMHAWKIGTLFIILQRYAGGQITDRNIIKRINNLPTDYDETLSTIKRYIITEPHPIWKQVLDGIEWLASKGIKNIDLNAGNIVKDGNDYKLIDVMTFGDVQSESITFDDKIDILLELL